jgi:hypothetical protein
MESAGVRLHCTSSRIDRGTGPGRVTVRLGPWANHDHDSDGLRWLGGAAAWQPGSGVRGATRHELAPP